MAVRADALRGFVGHLADRVAAAPADDIPASHNAYAMYCLWLLMSATVHRPVLDPFESRDVFDLQGGWHIAADKHVGVPTRPG